MEREPDTPELTRDDLLKILSKRLALERESGIPGMGADTTLAKPTAKDSYTGPQEMKPFHQSGKYIGAYEGYGATISDKDRLFYSTREPVGVWWVKGIAYDIWDNWFRVKNNADKDDETLDEQVQKTLLTLRARTHLPRETVFERRYGTAIILLSYTGFGSEAEWEKPLFTLNPDGSFPKLNKSKLLQITPYQKTALEISTIDDNDSSIRCGLPEFYLINRGTTSESAVTPSGIQKTGPIRVHWTRIIHDSPRLDEHAYLGIPAIDPIFDDLVGGRNARWGAYESYYRHGTGFPVIKSKATRAENEAWIAAGGLNDYLHVRGYFMCGIDEDFKFVGAEGSVLNPNTYFDMYFTFIAAGTGVAKESIQGVSAGRVTGSESNERQYYKSIGLQQNMKEPMLRELIDRLIQTGQVNFDGEYTIDWVDPFEVNPQDKAAIEFIISRTYMNQTWKTINEIRKENGMLPIEGGDVLLLQPGQMGLQGSNPAPNQVEPEREETEPEETRKPESTLLDKCLDATL